MGERRRGGGIYVHSEIRKKERRRGIRTGNFVTFCETDGDGFGKKFKKLKKKFWKIEKINKLGQIILNFDNKIFKKKGKKIITDCS